MCAGINVEAEFLLCLASLDLVNILLSEELELAVYRESLIL